MIVFVAFSVSWVILEGAEKIRPSRSNLLSTKLITDSFSSIKLCFQKTLIYFLATIGSVEKAVHAWSFVSWGVTG